MGREFNVVVLYSILIKNGGRIKKVSINQLGFVTIGAGFAGFICLK